jgi:hypothetical protein
MGTENPNGGSSSWTEWSKFVLKELERLNECYEKQTVKMDDLKESMTTMKVKMGFIGGIAGLVASVVMSLIIKSIFK